MENYDNDPELPLFSTVDSGYSASVLARILMNTNIDTKRVCHIQPLGVTKNVSFIADIDDVLLVILEQMIWVHGERMGQIQLISRCLQMDQYR